VRVLQTADVHLGDITYGRWKDQLADTTTVLRRFVDTAIERRVDLAVFAGDTFDRRVPLPAEIFPFVDAVSTLIHENIPVVIADGNHDGPGMIGNVEEKTGGWLARLPMQDLYAFPFPRIQRVQTIGDDILVYSIPYPHKRAFDSRPGTLREKTEAVSVAVEQAIRQPFETHHQFRSAIDHRDIPFVFVGHLSVLNAELGAEQAMRMGWDVTIRQEVLEGYDWSFLGHIHRPQLIQGSKAAYAGSPVYSDFGERKQDRVFLEVDVSDDVFTTQLPTGCRRMGTVDVNVTEDGWSVDQDLPGGPAGLVVRLRFNLPSATAKLPPAIRQKGLELTKDAYWTKVEVVRPKAESRHSNGKPAPVTMEDRLHAYLDSRGLPHEPYTSKALELIHDVDHPR
jgi:exonuclease SbcD